MNKLIEVLLRIPDDIYYILKTVSPIIVWIIFINLVLEPPQKVLAIILTIGLIGALLRIMAVKPKDIKKKIKNKQRG